jgi:hypothetical protein
MRRYLLIVMALSALLLPGAGRVALAGLNGAEWWRTPPEWWIRGNDTGGIIPYSPGLEGTYRELAAAHCARWGRLSHVTSVHRRYGDYISFVCMDRPGMIH